MCLMELCLSLRKSHEDLSDFLRVSKKADAIERWGCVVNVGECLTRLRVSEHLWSTSVWRTMFAKAIITFPWWRGRSRLIYLRLSNTGRSAKRSGHVFYVFYSPIPILFFLSGCHHTKPTSVCALLWALSTSAPLFRHYHLHQTGALPHSYPPGRRSELHRYYWLQQQIIHPVVHAPNKHNWPWWFDFKVGAKLSPNYMNNLLLELFQMFVLYRCIYNLKREASLN